MLALQRYRDTEQCPRCGGPKWICQAPTAESEWEAGPPVRCHVTTAAARAQSEHLKKVHAPHEGALVWPVRRRGLDAPAGQP